jgi:hypothetical protein
MRASFCPGVGRTVESSKLLRILPRFQSHSGKQSRWGNAREPERISYESQSFFSLDEAADALLCAAAVACAMPAGIAAATGQFPDFKNFIPNGLLFPNPKQESDLVAFLRSL